MRCAIIHNETHQYPYNFIYKSVIVEATTYSKIKVLTLIHLEKSTNFNCIMSLQDHIVLIYLNISRKTKFIKTLKFLVYGHLIICYTPPVNERSSRQLKVKI